MTTLEAIRQSIAPELRILNERIMHSLASTNEMMNNIIAGYLRTKGKQIRPILVLLSARLFSAEATSRVIDAAAAVEMLHNASLIHDDVVDDSKLRRGNPTVNGVWDNHIAVLTGDYFVSTALHLAITTGDLRIVTSLSRLGRLLSLGELDQIYNARFHRLDEQSYFEIIGRKTASLFVACVEMGAYAVGVDDSDPQLQKMRRFAELLGLCFQIRDDIFDYCADDSTIGKPTGNDLREGKITLPLLHVLLDESAPDHTAMLHLSQKPELTAGDVDTLINYAISQGGIDYAYSTMERLRSEAAELLAEFPDTEIRRSFLDLFTYIITRHN